MSDLREHVEEVDSDGLGCFRGIVFCFCGYAVVALVVFAL